MSHVLPYLDIRKARLEAELRRKIVRLNHAGAAPVLSPSAKAIPSVIRPKARP